MVSTKKISLSTNSSENMFIFLDALLLQNQNCETLYRLLGALKIEVETKYLFDRNSLRERHASAHPEIYTGRYNWNMRPAARHEVTKILAADAALCARLYKIFEGKRFCDYPTVEGAHQLLSIYTNNEAALRRRITQNGGNLACETREMHLALSDFPMEWVESRVPFVKTIIFYDLCSAFLTTGIVHPLLGSMFEQYEKGSLRCPWLQSEKEALLCFWRNDVEKAKKLLFATPPDKNEVSLEYCTVAATVLCFLNDASAVEWVRKGITRFKKQRGTSKNPYFAHYYGVIYNLARFLYGKATDLRYMQDNITALDDYRVSDYCCYSIGNRGLLALEALHRLRNGETDTCIRESRNDEQELNFLSYLLTASARLRLSAEKNPPMAELRSWYGRCAGLPLLQRCFADLLHALAGDNDTTWARGSDCPELLDVSALVRVSPDWEIRLAALEKLAGEGGREESRKRLIWVADIADNSLTAKEQTLGVRGWSKGKDVSLKRLNETKTDISYLTETDLRLISRIEFVRSWWNSMTCMLRVTSCCDELARAEHVYEYRDNTYIPLHFVRGNLKVALKEQEGRGSKNFVLCFENGDILLDRSTDSDDDVVLTRRDDVVTYYKLTAMEKDILRLIGGGMSFPKSELPRVLGLARSRLSLDVATDGVEAETVEEVLTPVLQLEQTASGFEAVTGVRPFGLPGTAFYRTGEGSTAPLATVTVESPAASEESAPEEAAPAKGKKSARKTKARTKKAKTVEAAADLNAATRTLRVERDFAAERAVLGELAAACPTLAQGLDNGHWFSTDIETVLVLLEELRNCGKPCTLEWPKGSRLRLRGSLQAKDVRAKISWASNDWFGITGSAMLDDKQMISLSALLSSLEGSRFVSLGDGEYVALTADLRRKLSSLKLVASENRKGDFEVNSLASAAVEQAMEEMEIEIDPKWQNNIERMHMAFATTPVVPGTLKAELREYQREGYEWMQRLAIWGVGACLADDMGLGKTVQAIAVMLNQAAKDACLVVAPTSVCGNWELEIQRFAPSLNVVRLGHTNREETVSSLGPNDVLVVGYGLLHNVQEALAGRSWSMVIFDEAQAMKNAATKRARAGRKIQADFRLALTGTPIENRIDDLWSLFNIINPGLLGSWDNFLHRYGAAAQPGTPASRALRAVVRPFLLRRLKSSVLDELPEKTEQNILIEPNPKELAFYEKLRRRAVDKLQNSDSAKGARRLEILAELTRLRRACCHPGLADPDMMNLEKHSSKTLRFLEIAQDLIDSGHKILAFSQFTSYLAQVREALDEKNISWQYLDGSTPEVERKKRVAAFQRGEGDVFLLSLKAGGTGLNLTAADYVVHLDPWWNPAVEDQASDRAHRIGQKRPVTIYRMVQEGSVEEKILSLHQSKRELAADFLEGTETSVKALTEEDLLMLMQ